MASIQQQQESARKFTEEEAAYVEPKVNTNSELAADVDNLLDEIDGILEENAEEFVAGYIQKGGQ